MPKHPSTIVIVGGGFAGVTVAQCLERVVSPKAEIVVLSTDNHMVFTPMLPEVVGRTISPLHVVVAGRKLTQRTKWLEARVTRIDVANNEAHYSRRDGTSASVGYTDLVLACGSAIDMKEIPGLASRGYSLKSVGDAIVMGNDLIGNFEAAAVEPDAKQRQRLLTVVVIGGGFSGVEVAGHIADLMRHIRGLYPECKTQTPRVILLQKGDRILPELNHDSLSAFALRKLRANGIDVRLNASAEKVDLSGVHLKSGEQLAAAMVVCTVGTTTRPLVLSLGIPLEKGRLKTDPDMRVAGTTNLWAIGDASLIPNAYDGHTCPATAQFAVQQARQLAENLERNARDVATKPFRYHPRGMLASIGHRNAVGEICGMKVSGFLAWFLWRGVYLAKLPTISRKLEVAVNWAFALPFSPNIVQLRMASRQPSKAPRKRSKGKPAPKGHHQHRA